MCSSFLAGLERLDDLLYRGSFCIHAGTRGGREFNTHTLDPWRADLEALRELLEEAGDEYVTRFVALRAAGYRFHFLTRAPE
ncbi:hypothetical protein F0U61_23060 [Archangium violaceum]|uniref:hypothetical protein n=1 Tax=Archangium violaceum TaxID=83451 RepID=UPI002B2DC22A|nr:hypothetical protein F0U61_23060 [Archangium violaceum]